MLLSFECISISSFHLRSAQDNAKKYFGHPDCFTVAKISPWIFFQYAGVPLIWFLNEKHLSFETMIHILNIPYASRLTFQWSYWFGLLNSFAVPQTVQKIYYLSLFEVEYWRGRVYPNFPFKTFLEKPILRTFHQTKCF